MPEKSLALANPLDEGCAINFAPKETFHALRDRSDEQIRAVIAQTIRDISPLCYED